MNKIPDGAVDMILADLPYGTTVCKWDEVIPFEELWEQYYRIIRPGRAIVLTASQPFTSRLVMSNLKGFAHELIWDKGRGHEPGLAKIRPQKAHESVLVFSKSGKNPRYNPQMIERDKPKIIKGNYSNNGLGLLSGSGLIEREYTHRYPTSVIKVTNSNQSNKLHPTQKPVDLLEYLIKTYSDEMDVVLDNTMGSGSTGVACVNTNRKFIGIELDKGYYDIAHRRIKEAQHIVV